MKSVPVLPRPLEAPHAVLARPTPPPPTLLRGVRRLETPELRHGTETDLRRAIELLPDDHDAARPTPT